MASPEGAPVKIEPKLGKRPDDLFATGTHDFTADMGNKLLDGVLLTRWQQARLDLIDQGVFGGAVATPKDLLTLDDGHLFNEKLTKFLAVAGKEGFDAQDLATLVEDKADPAICARAYERFLEIRGRRALSKKQSDQLNKYIKGQKPGEQESEKRRKGLGGCLKKVAVAGLVAGFLVAGGIGVVVVKDRTPSGPVVPVEVPVSPQQPAKQGIPEKTPTATPAETGKKTEKEKVKISLPSGLKDEQKKRYMAANDFDWSLIFGLDDYHNFSIEKEGGEFAGWRKRDVLMEVFKQWLNYKYGANEGADWINDLKNGTKTWREAIPDPKDQEKILKAIEIKSSQEFLTSFGDIEWIDWGINK